MAKKEVLTPQWLANILSNTGGGGGGVAAPPALGTRRAACWAGSGMAPVTKWPLQVLEEEQVVPGVP